MAIKYKTQQGNSKLAVYCNPEVKICKRCGNRLSSTITVMRMGGDPNMCMHCNFKLKKVD